MRRYRAPSRPPGAYCAGQSWADCITNTAGSDFRQAQRVRGAENWTCSGDFCMNKFCIYATSNGSKHREVFFVTDDEAEAERMASLFNELRRHHNEKYTIEKHKNDRNE